MMKTFREQKYLFEQDNTLKNILIKKELVLFLDYDGTLAPIAETPDKAVMTQEIREVIGGLSELPHCHLTVISGRKLSDLKTMISVPNIIYVGNHGFEIEEADFNLKSIISDQYRHDLAEIREQLKIKLSSVKGIWLEDKEIIISLHFRLAGEKGDFLARKIFMNVCQSYLSNQRINIMEGKKVLEIRPPVQWSKGEAAAFLLSKWQQQLGKDQIVTMYIGDDFTDEDAFKMLDEIAVTVKIGEPKRSYAQYYLNNQEEMITLLSRILVIETRLSQRF